MITSDALLTIVIKRIRDAGLVPPPDRLEADGQFRRWAQPGDRDSSSFYCLRPLNGSALLAIVGDFRRGISVRFTLNMDAADQEDLEQAQAEFRDQLDQRHRKVAEEARRLWAQAPAASSSHPYLVAKGIGPGPARRRGERLLLALEDSTGQIWTLQFIGPGGKKRFLTGGRTRGCFIRLGDWDDADRLLVAEGFATAQTLVEATGLAAVAAGSAGNLEAVARALRSALPTMEIVVCGDRGEVGEAKARAAAQASGAALVFPPGQRPAGFDFNDLAQVEGLEAVTAVLTGVEIPAATSSATDRQGRAIAKHSQATQVRQFRF